MRHPTDGETEAHYRIDTTKRDLLDTKGVETSSVDPVSSEGGAGQTGYDSAVLLNTCVHKRTLEVWMIALHLYGLYAV